MSYPEVMFQLLVHMGTLIRTHPDPDAELLRDPLNPVGALGLLWSLDEGWIRVPVSVPDKGTVPLTGSEGELESEPGGEEGDEQRPRAIPRGPQGSVD
jgi:hypothetical protein